MTVLFSTLPVNERSEAKLEEITEQSVVISVEASRWTALWKASVPLRAACRGPSVMWAIRSAVQLPERLPAQQNAHSSPQRPARESRAILSDSLTSSRLLFNTDISQPINTSSLAATGPIQPSRNSLRSKCTDVTLFVCACTHHLLRCHYRKSIYMSNCLLIHFIIKFTIAIRDIYILIGSLHAWEWRCSRIGNANQSSEKH